MSDQNALSLSRSGDKIGGDIALVEHADHGEVLKQDADLIISQDTRFAAFTRRQALRHFWTPVLFCRSHDDDGDIVLSASSVSLWGAMMPVGMIPGSFLAGFVNDKFGRKGGLLCLSIFYIAGTIVEMVATTPGQWAAAKFLFGFGQGLTTATVPVYVSEVAPPQLRGTLLCFYGFIFAIGQLFASVVLYTINNNRPNDWLLAVETEWAFHGLWVLFALPWLPETHWYYARKGKEDKALRSLNRIYKGIKDFNPDHEMNAITHELQRETESTSAVSAWTDLFRGTNRIRSFGAGLAIASQLLAGTIVIFTYTTYFVQEAGIGEPFLASMIITIILLVGLITSFFLVEILGRRTLLIGGGLSCTVCNLVVGITGCFEKTTSLNNVALAFIFIWVFSYALSFAGVSWAMVSEASSARLKSKTASFATLMYDLVLLVFTLCVPYMLAQSGPGSRDWGTKTLFMFAITIGLCTIGNYFLCPETKGRTQNEIDEMYERKIPPRKFSKYVSELENVGGKKAN